jgi:hypothetical protein
MGHETTNLIFAHYREIVRPKEAGTSAGVIFKGYRKLMKKREAGIVPVGDLTA